MPWIARDLLDKQMEAAAERMTPRLARRLVYGLWFCALVVIAVTTIICG